MLRQIIDFICGGSYSRIWDVVHYDKTWHGNHCYRAACPRCKENKFNIWFSGGLFSIGCVNCNWYSGINNTGNRMDDKAVLNTDMSVTPSK